MGVVEDREGRGPAERDSEDGIGGIMPIAPRCGEAARGLKPGGDFPLPTLPYQDSRVPGFKGKSKLTNQR